METPPARLSKARASPKEDGEHGETIGDLLRRHGHELDGELGTMVKELRENVDVFGPRTIQMVGRMLSAALSPMPDKASPQDAIEALRTFTSESVPERRATRGKAKVKKERIDKETAEAVSERIMEEVARREALMERKRALGSPQVIKRKKRDNLGN